MLKEAYVRIAIKGRVKREPIGVFPNDCPNCCLPWEPRENWLYRGIFKTGGKEAICRYCGCHMMEVIYTERALPQAE